MIKLRELSFAWDSNEVVGRLQDGWTVQRVQSADDYALETYFLGHCLGTKNFKRFEVGHRVFSLRDEHQIPHATVLCLKPDVVSPYMSCNDLGVTDHINVDGELMRVLQIRGRMDVPARLSDLTMVRKWWEEHSMREITSTHRKLLAIHAAVFGDKDTQYHEEYLMDEEDNPYKDVGSAGDVDNNLVSRGYLSW